MKIYKLKPKQVVRLQIAKLGEKAKYITFSDTTLENAQEVILKLIIDNAKLHDPFSKRTSLNFRNANGGENLKSSTKSFIGLSVDETYEMIINHFKDKQNEE